jgi:hypothetical protein
MTTTDSTAVLTAINDILLEWTECQRKGQITLHSDGHGIKKIEFNYSIDLFKQM